MDVCFTVEIVQERVFAYRVNIDIAALKSQPRSGDLSLALGVSPRLT